MTKHISIHDYENNRVIWAQVPEYLVKMNGKHDDENIAQAIFDALGISSGSSEWMMMVDGDHVLADHNGDSDRPNERGIELLTQDFKANAIESLKNTLEDNDD